MRNIVDIHYFDYVLYKYLELFMTPAPAKDTVLYYSGIIEVMHRNLKERGYHMEEEIALKYVVFQVLSKFLEGFYKEDTGQTLVSIFASVRDLKPEKDKIRLLIQVLLWAYDLLVNQNDHSQLSGFLSAAQAHREVQMPPASASRLGECSLEKKHRYHEKIREKVLGEVQDIFAHLSVPLLMQAEKEQKYSPPRAPSQPSVATREEEEQDMDMIMAEFSSIYESRGCFLGFFPVFSPDASASWATAGSRPNSALGAGSSAQMEDAENMQPSRLQSILGSSARGEEVFWSEPDIEAPAYLLREKVEYPDGAVKYKGRMPLSARKRKVWRPEEELRFIEGVRKHSKCWKAIQEEIFTDLTEQQIKEKYRSLVRSGKYAKLIEQKE